MAEETHARLEILDLSKTFGVNKALDRVALSLQPGEIRGLIGQNGSGKSTLVKVLSGYHHGAAGELLVDGARIGLPVHPAQLREKGLSFVHQDLGLVPSMSVADNIRVGRFKAARITRNINDRAERATTGETLRRLNSGIDPRSNVSRLSAAERAVVAIARALQDHEPGQGCVVFDESSRALPRETLAEFYELIRQLAAEGTSVLIVSHRLDEVLALTHRVTVLRDGRVVGDLMTAQTSERELSRLVLGFDRDRSPLQDAMPTTPQGLVLEVDKVTGRRCRDTSFRVYGGEVVGLIGPTESGYEELPYLISGSAPATGQLVVSGVPSELGPADPLRFLKQEMAFVPSERATEGLALSLSVVENLTLPRVRSRSSRVHLSPRWQKRDYETIAISLGITPRDHNLPTGHLSGGNQQKVLLGKWLLGNPRVLIAHEPTQAVDVGARRDILAALRRAAQMGAGVLISSAEAEDLASTCDRVLVMAEGAVVHELLPPFDADTIIAATYPIVEPEGLAS